MSYRMPLFLSLTLLLSACGPSGGGNNIPQLTVATTTDPGTTTTTTTTVTVDTVDTAPPEVVVDCANLPTAPTAFAGTLSGTGYHDVEFDDLGNLIGNDPSNGFLTQATSAGGYGVYASTGRVQQMQRLADGDLAIAADDTGIMRVTAQGSVTPINTSLRPYGLILGNDDMLYAAVEQDGVYRVDPNTGAATEIIGNLPNGSPRVINFSPDYSRMYIGTLFGNGDVYYVDLDADLNPTTAPATFASNVGTGAYTDTLGVDICGNLYVSDYSFSAIYRISPSGQVQTYVDSSASFHTHGMAWGNGIGGWLEAAIYVTQPYNGNQVAELVIGVPSRLWTGTVINQP
ncbi:MAG: hypothetical protein GWP91_08275 [Rhodobacterales bacterium]|nr:hypothetical protein [Rhodobacterales bacterium]